MKRIVDCFEPSLVGEGNVIVHETIVGWGRFHNPENFTTVNLYFSRYFRRKFGVSPSEYEADSARSG